MTFQTSENENLQVTQLVTAAQGGDRSAFGELFARFERHVFAIALRRLGDYSEAEELTQDVFIQALTKIAQLRVPEAFAGWLRSITNRMAINKMVRRGPESAADPEILDGTFVEASTPADLAMEAEDAREVRRGLSDLRDMDRETLEAFYVEGRSLVEMADQFDAPIGTIKRRLHVARKRLAKKVERLANA